MSWPIKKLGEVCKVIKGKKPTLYKQKGKDMLPYLGARFMRGSKEAEYARIKDVNSISVSIKDLIIICDGSKSGDMFSGFEGVLSSTMGKMSFSTKEVDSKYLKSFLDLNFSLFNNAKKGAAIPHLDLDLFRNLEFPLPALPEQKKIVAKLEQLLAKIKEVKRLRAEAQEAAQSLVFIELQRVFEHGKDAYKLEELGNVAKLVRGPFGGSLKKEIFVDSGDCVYEQGNVIDNDLKNFRYFITPKKFEEMRRFEVFSGDILMSCSGTIGRFVIVPKEFKRGVINQALLKISPNQEITVDFLKYALQDYLSLSSTHIKGMAIKNIAAVKELKRFKIPLPPILEQKKIVAHLDSLSEKLRQLQEHQKRTQEDLDALEQSILAMAFSGKMKI